jgi:3-oxoacyl-[acyl-carrier-protein] synthase II
VARQEGGEGRAIKTARVGDFGAREAIDPQKLRRIPRLSQMCIVAARQALGDDPAALFQAVPGDRVGVILGTGLGAFEQTMEFTAGYLNNGPEGASPAMFPVTVMNTAAAMVAMEFKLGGTNITVNHRDLSVPEAVATARDQLLCGRADAILTGGFDEVGPWMAHAMGRLCRLCGPDDTMRPYDRRRGGTALGEGAVIVLLERGEAARRRGARIWAEIAGIGRAGDDRPRIGWRRPGSEPAFAGAAASVEQALGEAGLFGAQVDYIAGGGNGSDLDRIETLALRQALGAAAERVAISSIIGQTGESMMSPGLRLLAALYAIGQQELPGTLGCEEPDPAASLSGLRLVPGAPAAPIETALCPVFAQGGGNVSIVLRRPTE